MRISTKGRYAVRALLEMADSISDKPLLLSYVANKQEIPERYLIQIFSSLRKAGIVNSFRGAKGGFQLAKRTEDLTLADVLEAAEGPIEIIDCLQKNYENCQRLDYCLTKSIWEKVNTEVRSVFQRITLADMYRMQKEQKNQLQGNYQI
jgi:Rrf2 family transcriptional regulator, cysteine metabolism repressor